MKTRVLSMLVVAAAAICNPVAASGRTQATLAWNAVVDPKVTGYVLYWGTNSGSYPFSVGCASNQTSATVSNLSPGVIYFFAVKASATNGLSDFSNEAVFTNSVTEEDLTPPSNGTNSESSGTNSESSNNNNSGNNNNSAPVMPPDETAIAGIPPVLDMAFTNGRIHLTILGTVGANVVIMSTTNPASLDGWAEVTNLTLSNAAALNPPPEPPPGALADAFVPASQSWDIPQNNTPSLQLFRTMMPYDYVILAGMTLPAKGESARLIVVNMPGFVDDVCYSGSGLLYCDKFTYGFGTESSGSTIRQIATTYANSLSLNWTSASEFVYSNGMGEVLATVVETEDPSSDPVAGPPGSGTPIEIDF